MLRAIPPRSKEGRIGRSSRHVERGMRWTLWRRARFIRADERRRCGRKSVWSWPPDAEAKSCGDEPRDDGSKKARFPGRARYKR